MARSHRLLFSRDGVSQGVENGICLEVNEPVDQMGVSHEVNDRHSTVYLAS
jgi:hypothetical protein